MNNEKDGGSHLGLGVVDQIPDEHEQHKTTDGQIQLTTQLSRLGVNIDQQPRSGTGSG